MTATKAILFGDLRLTISASSVAWYGAIIATIGFIVSAYNVLRDRAKVKVWYSWDNSVAGDPQEKGIKYLRVDVTNLGRRPIKVTHVGAKMHGDSRTILFTASFHKQNEDRILTEQNPSTLYMTDQKGMDKSKLWYIYAIDARGKEFRVYPFLKDRLKFWINTPHRLLTRYQSRRKMK